MAVHLHEEDLPAEVRFADGPIAVDTEAMGLIPGRDRLCLVQLSDGKGDEHLVRFKRGKRLFRAQSEGAARRFGPAEALPFRAVRYRHHEAYLGIMAAPLYCTRTASRLVRTYTDRHGLKDLVKELLNIDVSKQQQTQRLGRRRALAMRSANMRRATCATSISSRKSSTSGSLARIAPRLPRPVSISSRRAPCSTLPAGPSRTFSRTMAERRTAGARNVKQRWAEPGSAHDRLVRWTKIALPSAVGVLLAILALAPLEQERRRQLHPRQEEGAERARADAGRGGALYRHRRQGAAVRDDRQPRRSAQLRHADRRHSAACSPGSTKTQGRCMISADQGRYNLDTQQVAIDGPVKVAGDRRLSAQYQRRHSSI